MHLHRLPSELLATLSHQEANLLRAYYRRNPWGEQRADWRAAMLAHVTARCAGNTDTSIEDFLPDLEPVKLIPFNQWAKMVAASAT